MKVNKKGFNTDYQQESPTIDQIKAMSGYAILEFGVPWCGHCQAASLAVQVGLSGWEWPHIKVFDGKGKPLGRAFHIKLWPTLILLNSGSEVARLVRPLQADEVRALLPPMA